MDGFGRGKFEGFEVRSSNSTVQREETYTLVDKRHDYEAVPCFGLKSYRQGEILLVYQARLAARTWSAAQSAM